MKNIEGIKHQIECNCILPQFMNSNPVVFHRFNVFSIIDENGNVVPSYAQCNNCDAIHKVIEIGVSKQLPKESSNLLPNLIEIKQSIPENVRAIAESYKVDLPTWQEIQFIYENEKWGRKVILFKEEDDGKIIGKMLLILGKSIFKIENFIIEESEEENE
jgi:hypothetical protein